MIEDKLERIAVALESIANRLIESISKKEVIENSLTTQSIPPVLKIKKEVEEKKILVPPVPPAPKKEIVQMSIEELNEALMVEYTRLNEDRTKIDNIIKKHGAPSLSSLDPNKYSAVLEDVKKLS